MIVIYTVVGMAAVLGLGLLLAKLMGINGDL